MAKTSKYKEIKPVDELKNYIHSFWMHKNLTDKAEKLTIFPDSYFKIIMIVRNNKITAYFMTGLWTEEKIFTIPPKAKLYGCRLKILAPEFLLKNKIASIINEYHQLDLKYLNVNTFDLSGFKSIVNQWQQEFLKLKPSKTIQGNKSRLSQLLDKMKGDISATEVSNQIYWTNRQINRYLNKYNRSIIKKVFEHSKMLSILSSHTRRQILP